MKKILTLFLILNLISFVASQDFYPTTVSDLDVTIKVFGYGNINGLKENQEVVFQTLTFQNTEYQKIIEIEERLQTKNNVYYPEYVIDEFGNKYAKFVIKDNGDFNYEINARIQTNTTIHEIKETNIGDYPDNVKLFTEKSNLIESDSIEIISLMTNKLKSDNFVETLNQTIFWVNDYVEYAQGEEFQTYYLLQKSAIETLFSKKGVCDEFANLAAALLRAKNIPTRINFGPTFDGKEWGNHAWIETYHNNYGWIPSDPTFREQGFVDGTHIKMGSFNDISLSQAKAIFPENVSINFQTKTLPEAIIHSIKYFSNVELKKQNTTLKNNQWNEFFVEVINNSNKNLFVPIKIKENYTELLFDTKTLSVELKPNEKKIVTFLIHPNIKLTENQSAIGQITLNSLTEPFEINFEVENSLEQNNGKILIKDIVPIQTINKIFFDIKITNNTNQDETITITLNDQITKKKVNAFQSTWEKIEILIDSNEYQLKIETKNEIYSTIIQKIDSKIIQQEEKKQTIITQEIESPTTKPLFNLLHAMIFLTLLIVSIIILIVFSTKKKYI